MANNQCKECGCICSKCSDHDVHLHVEIENLKQRLVEKENHIVTMETNFLNEANKFPNGEVSALREELITWQDKYKRLYEAHRRVQRVNQGLEDKLLKLVDVSETEKNTLTKDIATLSHKLADANYTIKKVTEDNERYKNDLSLALQFLQCKPGNFVSQKYDTLPNEVQAKVSNYMVVKKKPEERRTLPDMKSIKVPIPTFPPTAMVYSVPKTSNYNRLMDEEEAENSEVDIVSAAIMAKVLEERERERSCVKHCDTCTCSKHIRIITHNTHHSVSTQTGSPGSTNTLCLKCNHQLENSPPLVNIVKNVDNNKNVYNLQESNNQNVAKVQPNNFLIDKKLNESKMETSSDSKSENLIDLNSPTIRDSPNEVIFFNINEKKEKPLTHHKLCKNTKLETSEIYKGGRQCSMRLQTGSKNILLDSKPNAVSPVLYTHSEMKSNNSKSIKPESISSGDCKTSSSLSESTSNQRVADWIQTIDVGSTSDYSESLNSHPSSRTDDKTELDKVKYKQMEDNVKRFLFGEYNFVHKKNINEISKQD